MVLRRAPLWCCLVHIAGGLVLHRSVRAPISARAAPEGWTDVSGGRGECCYRTLRPAPEPRGESPPEGAVCDVRWTAWLAERSGAWWSKGARVGLKAAMSELEFTLGGGSKEATRSWDACVARMATGEAIEIVADSAYAFGDGAEPHVPSGATVVFELELAEWRDWAADYETFGADAMDDDDDDVLEDEIARASNKGLLEDLKLEADSIAKAGEDVGDVRMTFGEGLEEFEAEEAAEKAEKAAEAENSLFPKGGGIDGTTRDGVRWRETPSTVELEIALPRAAEAGAKNARVDISTNRLDAYLDGERIYGGPLEGTTVPDEASWSLTENRKALEVILVKKPGDVWARPFKAGS